MFQSRFFANHGASDFFKLWDSRVPTEEFLKNYLNPEGWVLSMVYNHQMVPSGRKMFDSGAKKYLFQEVPIVQKTSITAQWMLERVRPFAKVSDICMAPDHIIHPSLVKEFDIDLRRKFNRESAEEFLELSKFVEFTPMAICHGLDLWEKVASAQWLYRIGYRYIGIGGLVPDANNLQYCVTTVRTIKRHLPPDAKLHVLGLNSPIYSSLWSNLEIESFDGSSYHQYAIRKGKWLQAEGHRLIQYNIVKDGESPTAPTCECPVCQRLLAEGIDNRIDAGRLNSLGRIAHNLGQQIAAQRNSLSRKQLALVSCVEQKLNQPAQAKDLYNSQWFKAARDYVESNGFNWYAVSARHGILSPDKIVEPYDETLKGKSAKHRREWAEKVCQQLESVASPGAEIIFLTGKRYREFVVPQLLTTPERLWTARTPLAGLLGIGYQLQFFKTFTPAGFKRFSLN